MHIVHRLKSHWQTCDLSMDLDSVFTEEGGKPSLEDRFQRTKLSQSKHHQKLPLGPGTENSCLQNSVHTTSQEKVNWNTGLNVNMNEDFLNKQ